MADDLSRAEKKIAHRIPAWAVVRVVPAAPPPPRKRGERRVRRAAPATQILSFHLTRASALEEQERRGGPPGDETEGFDVSLANLLQAFQAGAFSIEEVRRQIERETEPLTADEQVVAARTALWTVWYEDRFGYGEDRDPAVPVAHFFTEEEAHRYVADNGGEPTPERFTGYTATRGTLLEARNSGTIETNHEARALLEKIPPSIEQKMFERVRDFVVEETGVKAEAVTPDAALVDDLGITGRAGAELMARFFDAFDVSPSGFEVTVYFTTQKMGLLGSMSSIFGDAPARRSLSVDDLVGAALVKRWLA